MRFDNTCKGGRTSESRERCRRDEVRKLAKVDWSTLTTDTESLESVGKYIIPNSELIMADENDDRDKEMKKIVQILDW